MKRNISMITLLSCLALLITGAVIMSSCEGPVGPAGPEGPEGPEGPAGPAGTDGTDGVDGNAVCLQCHTVAMKDAVTAEYETSGHAAGAAVSHAGGNKDCAKCHSHEGFVETVFTGEDTTAADIPLPQRIQCKTCHSFHNSLDFENEINHAIRQMDPVVLLANGETVEFANEESNLCMHCHQARRDAPDDTDGTVPFTVTSTHWGAHHGPQANLVNGFTGYEFGQDLSTSGSHELMANCVFCHMTAGTDGGGHTFTPTVESCTACHPDATDFDIDGAVTEIEGLLDDLKTALITAGMLDAEGGIVAPKTAQTDTAGALWNYLLVEEDRSMGVHNPDYAKALLEASITYMGGK
jgi:hypothetical protein